MLQSVSNDLDVRSVHVLEVDLDRVAGVRLDLEEQFAVSGGREISARSRSECSRLLHEGVGHEAVPRREVKFAAGVPDESVGVDKVVLDGEDLARVDRVDIRVRSRAG